MGEIRPHLIRYWLHSSEKIDSPETFAKKVNEICTVYHEAEEVHEKGGHTISVDEMTGIQALEHKYPDKPVIPGKAARMEFEYIRHGTTSLIGFFDVATGRMEKPYLNSTRTEEDFVEAIRALAETDPEAPWTFVCDGINTHKSESLVQFVAEQCGLSEDLGMFFAPTFCRMLQHLSSSLQEPDVPIGSSHVESEKSIANILHNRYPCLVSKILRDGDRKITERFRLFSEHYRFRPVFMNPESGNEKSNVENKVGYLRRNELVPVPRFLNLPDFNRELLTACDRDMTREHYDKDTMISTLFEAYRKALIPLPSVPFDTALYSSARTDKYGKCTLNKGKHRYSVSSAFCEDTVQFRITSATVTVMDSDLYGITIHNE